MPRYSSKRGRGGSISASHAGSGAHSGSMGSGSGGGAVGGANAAPSIQFGAAVSDRKATAAKSAGTIGKWGVTSFTSIRSSIVNGGSRVMECGGGGGTVSASGRSTLTSERNNSGLSTEPSGGPDPFSFQSNTPTATNGTSVPKVKKFFKSRNTPAVVAAAAAVAEQRRQMHAPQTAVAPLNQKQAERPSLEATVACETADLLGGDGDTKKFFSSPAQLIPQRDSSTLSDHRLPPLKLRISRDKDTGDLTAGVSSSSSVSSSPEKAASPPPSTSLPETIADSAPPAKKRRPPGRPPGHVNKASRRGGKRSPPPLLRAPYAASPPPADSAPVRRSRRAAAAEARERVARSVRECDNDGAVIAASIAASAVGVEADSEVKQARLLAPKTLHRSSNRTRSQEDSPGKDQSSVLASVPSAEPVTAEVTPSINCQSNADADADCGAVAADGSVPRADSVSTCSEPPSTANTSTEEHTVSIASCDQLESQLNSLFDGSAGGSDSGDQQQQQQPMTSQTAGLTTVINTDSQVETMESKVYTKGVKDLYRYERLRGSENSDTAPVVTGSTISASSDPASTHIDSAHTATDSAPIATDSSHKEIDSAHSASAHSPGHYSSIADKLHALDGESAFENDDDTKSDAADVLPRLTRSLTEPVASSCTESTQSAADQVSAPVSTSAAASQPDSQVTSAGGSSTTSTTVVESRKPGSIFKSRAGRSTRARYQHRWTDDSGPNQHKQPGARHGSGAPGGSQAGTTAGSGNSGGNTAAMSALDFCDESESDRVSAVGPGGTTAGNTMTSSPAGVTSGGDTDPGLVTRLVRVNTWHGSNPGNDLDSTGQMVTSVKCHRAAKEYYTLIKNVKKAYQVQELGEYQEYNDDIEYIMDALQSTNNVMTRCLSALRLAEKCTVAAFRMHVRAQGTAVRFFAALCDAASEPSLAVCTAAVMFTLSQDQLNMDLDKTSLELMLALIDTDPAVSSDTNQELDKHITKVRSLCAQLQRQGHAKTIDLGAISSSYLAMETLLSLTSERAGAWFKEELRTLGGLDHLMRTVCQSRDWLDSQLTCMTSDPVTQLGTESIITTLRKVERCLRVIENVTSRNEENQGHLLCSEETITAVCSLLVLFQCRLSLLKPPHFTESASPASTLLSTTKTLLKVLVNLSHEPRSSRPVATYGSSTNQKVAAAAASQENSEKLGSWKLGQRRGFITAAVAMVIRVVPHAIPEPQQFDTWLLNTYLLINLTETQACNQTVLASMTYGDVISLTGQSTPECDANDDTHCSVVSKLVDLFYRLVALASEVENNADRLLESDLYTAQSETKPAGSGNGSAPETGSALNNGVSVASEADLVSQTASALVQKAGHHMEKTVIAAYIGVIIGHIAMSNKERESAVQQCLRGGHFTGVVEVLTKLLNFLDLTKTGRADSQEMKTIRRVLNYMQQVDTAAFKSHSPTHTTDNTPDCNSLSMFD